VGEIGDYSDRFLVVLLGFSVLFFLRKDVGEMRVKIAIFAGGVFESSEDFEMGLRKAFLGDKMDGLGFKKLNV